MDREGADRRQKWIRLAILIVFLVQVGAVLAQTLPRNIILFIGDGMGVAHITAAKTVKGVLAMERFKTVGLVTTHAHDAYITDSAAGGTALATGFKSYNGAISFSPDGETLKTVLEVAEECGRSTGLVATCAITHATPAVFAAHVDHRSKQPLIAEHMVHSGVDVIFGGGLGFFLPASDQMSSRADQTNLIRVLEKTHFVATTPEMFHGMGTPERAVGLFATGHLPPVAQRSVGLAEMTKKALDILSMNEKGFFLMVEGSQIDWASHRKDIEGIIAETVDLDDAVAIGLDFAEKHPHTLLLVTADHETGGLAVEDGSIEARRITKSGFTTGSHTGEMVPLFATGPGSEYFGGIVDNTHVGRTLIELLERNE